MTKHIDTVMASCARTLYGLRTLQAYGMPQASLQLVFWQPPSLNYSTSPLLGGALQMLARGIDWRVFSDELAHQVIIPVTVYPLWLPSVNRLMNDYFVHWNTTLYPLLQLLPPEHTTWAGFGIKLLHLHYVWYGTRYGVLSIPLASICKAPPSRGDVE